MYFATCTFTLWKTCQAILPVVVGILLMEKNKCPKILITRVGQGGQPLSLGYTKHWGVCYTHFSILFSLILVVFSVYDEYIFLPDSSYGSSFDSASFTSSLSTALSYRSVSTPNGTAKTSCVQTLD